jgi:LAO/AO transport system kinase
VSRAPLDRRALGRELTRLANASAQSLLADAAAAVRGPAAVPATAAPAAPARRIGLTGAPGAGKSSLAGRLALYRSRQGARRVGVLAVDPSSPHTGGAILGDRIRMDELPGSAELYIRSVGSRSSSDGLSDNLPEMLELMEAHGFDEVLLETVGVGQAEHAARVQVDTLVLVLLPDSGDAVQAMKAGIMELADLYVVNKADLPGAQRMAADVQRVTALSRSAPGAWQPPVLLASSQQPDSIAALSEAIDAHGRWLLARADGQALRLARARYRLGRVLERLLAEQVRALDAASLQAPLAEQVRTVLGRMLAPPLRD